MSLRLNLALLFLVFAASLVGEEPVAGPDLVVLVKKLSHEDFKVREQATRDLIAQGKEAGRKLISYRNHVDLEVQVRIDHVLGAMGIMTPEKEKALELLMARLFEVPAKDRRSTVNDIAVLGTVALDRLQARLVPGESQLKAVCIPAAKWHTASDQEAKGWTVRLTNEGDRPLFITPPRINRHGHFSRGLAPSRPWMNITGGGGGGRTVSRFSRSYSLGNARVLAPGQSIELTPRSPRLTRPGRCYVHFDVEISSKDEVDKRTLWFGTRRKKEKGEGWEAKPLRAGAGVCVYPDWTEAQTGRGVTLSVASKAQTVRAGTTLEANVCMENKSDKAVPVDKEWMRYCWVAFAHHKGSDLVSATAFDLRSPKTPDTAAQDKFQPHNLAPGESITQKIAITIPKTAGLYHFAAGYELPPLRDRGEDEDAPLEPGEKLVARAVDVQVVTAE